MTLSLANLLSSGVPALWYVTPEPTVGTARVVSNAPEDVSVFRFDAQESCLKISLRDQLDRHDEWVTYLHEEQDRVNEKVQDLNQAMHVVLNLSGKSIFITSEGMGSSLGGLFAELNMKEQLRWQGRHNGPSCTFVVLAPNEEKIPEILKREIALYEDEFPTLEELSVFAGGFDAPQDVAKAGLGLSTFEFRMNVHDISNSDCENAAKEMHERKRAKLRGDDILDLRKPKLTLDDVGGMDKAKELVEKVRWAWENPELVKELGVTPMRRFLLVGVPGVGKSLTCEAIASSLGTDLAKGGISQSMSKWIGESERNVRQMFKALKALAPLVFWVDEFGRDAAGGDHDGGTANRTHGEFLTGIQELPDDVFFAAAANRIEDLPPEMTRADRFDIILFSGFPTEKERADIFGIHLNKGVTYDIEALAARSSYFTGAEIKHLIKKASMESAYAHSRPPTTKELLQAIPTIKSRVWVNHRENITRMYEHAMLEWEWASTEQEAEAEQVLRDAKNPPSSVTRYTPKATKSKMTFAQ